MKKTLLILFSALALNLQAEVITLDLSKPTTPATLEYDEKGDWKEVTNDAADFATLDFQIFSFLHNGHGTHWDGFSISKSTSTAPDDYNGGCMAKGGLQGEGTPYLVGYWSAYADATQVIFNDGKAYYPKEVNICQSPLSYNDILNGSYTGYVFKKGDYFTLTITALNEEYEPDETRTVTYYLADYRGATEDSWTLNSTWEKVDLTPLGAVYGLAFSMESTDTGTYGMNTSGYFTLDGLAVSSDVVSSVATITVPEGMVDWQIYTITGQYLGQQTATFFELRNSLADGMYIVRSGEYALKIVK